MVPADGEGDVRVKSTARVVETNLILVIASRDDQQAQTRNEHDHGRLDAKFAATRKLERKRRIHPHYYA